MQLKINKNNQENYKKLFFTPDYILLVKDEQVLLSYKETELKFIFNITLVNTPLHNRHSYVLKLSPITLVLQSKDQTFQIPVLVKVAQILSLFKEHHPFKELTFQFSASQDDACILLAQELEQLFKKSIAGEKAELSSFYILSSLTGEETFVRKESYFMSPNMGLWFCIVYILLVLLLIFYTKF